jgi:EAL domain-containing protein (putative c-di-GMP-specific phosphodiesterase class I)
MLGMAVSAEGVETVEQSTWLRERDCAELQGFYFSRPLEAAEVEALMRASENGAMPPIEVAGAAAA